MLKIERLDDSLAHEWGRFVDDCHESTIFHGLDWLTLCERHQGTALSKLGFYQDGELVGIFPLYTKKMLLLKVAASPFVVEDTPYLGPLVRDQKLLPDAVSAIDRYIKGHGINFLRFTLKDKCRHELFEPYRYMHKVRHTHVLDLTQGEENIWKNMEGRARTAVRKAEKSGVTCSIVNDSDRIDTYYQLSETLYQNQNKVPPNSKMFYQDICFGALRDKSRLIAAELDGSTIACAIVILHKDTVYYLDAVSDKKYNTISPSSALQWFIIQMAIKEGFARYDFVGSDMPWIAKFKESFGGKLHEYSLLEKASPQWVFTLRNFYGRKLKPAIQKIKAGKR